jgi:serine/threonine protein phosphatase PrpC
MLRVAEQYAATDTGRQRRANEDALLARSPLFVVADGMGGAQAGEVASQIAVDHFRRGLEQTADPELALAELARAANARIYERSHIHSDQAGMGTTLTAVYVGEDDISIAHVGDSRAYLLRDGRLTRLTEDHSLVDELMRQGRLTPEEAVEHPQRSVITRALGPEGTVEVDTRTFRARAGDVYLVCSDGLTSMLAEDELAATLTSHPHLQDAGEALIAAANAAGGRDNITVVLVRLEEVSVAAAAAGTDARGADGAIAGATSAPTEEAPATTPTRTGVGHDPDATVVGVPAMAGPVAARAPRRPQAPPAPARKRRARVRRAVAALSVAAVLGLIGAGAYLALTSVYFIGTNDRGLVTLYRGVPFRLPFGLALYSRNYVSGVSAGSLAPTRRHSLLDHSLRSQSNAAGLIRSLELGQLE